MPGIAKASGSPRPVQQAADGPSAGAGAVVSVEQQHVAQAAPAAASTAASGRPAPAQEATTPAAARLVAAPAPVAPVAAVPVDELEQAPSCGVVAVGSDADAVDEEDLDLERFSVDGMRYFDPLGAALVNPSDSRVLSPAPVDLEQQSPIIAVLPTTPEDRRYSVTRWRNDNGEFDQHERPPPGFSATQLTRREVRQRIRDTIGLPGVEWLKRRR